LINRDLITNNILVSIPKLLTFYTNLILMV